MARKKGAALAKSLFRTAPDIDWDSASEQQRAAALEFIPPDQLMRENTELALSEARSALAENRIERAQEYLSRMRSTARFLDGAIRRKDVAWVAVHAFTLAETWAQLRMDRHLAEPVHKQKAQMKQRKANAVARGKQLRKKGEETAAKVAEHLAAGRPYYQLPVGTRQLQRIRKRLKLAK